MSGDGNLSVVMLPDVSDSNPYQARLAEALERRDVTVSGEPVLDVLPLSRAWLRSGRPDVVHLHWVDTFVNTDRAVVAILLGVSFLVELAVLRLLGIDVVWTVHNLASHERRHPRVEDLLRRVVARVATRLVVHCETAREQVRTAYDLPDRVTTRIRVVPHGNYIGCYPDDVGRREARRELDIPDEVTVVLYFGLVREYKNVPQLIRTFGSLDDDARLVVVGNPWTDALEQRVRSAAAGDDRVRTVLEYVPDEDIQVYMNAADVVVYPFESVLTSGSTLLAMSFGRAVVVPDLGCPGELVDERGGVLYDPDDPDGLSNALQEAVSEDTDLAWMGRYNRRVAAALDWETIASRTRDIYHREDILADDDPSVRPRDPPARRQ